jgi:hypothetical protein
MTAAEVRESPGYVPARIREGAVPSARNCVGCPDLGTRETPRGTLMWICRRSGTVVHRTPPCPKWPEVRA